MEWISIEKEFPPINVRVIIHFTYKGVYAKYSPTIGWLDKNGWHINDLYVFPADRKITHWMHLPDTPESLTKRAADGLSRPHYHEFVDGVCWCGEKATSTSSRR